MQPSDGFWEGVGTSVGSSPGWMVIGALLVVGVLFVIAKYIYPGHKEIKMRELDIREREADNQQALAEGLHSVVESNGFIAREFAAQNAGIEESKARSREMGGKVDRIDSTTRHTDTLVEDIHKHIFREGTD